MKAFAVDSCRSDFNDWRRAKKTENELECWQNLSSKNSPTSANNRQNKSAQILIDTRTFNKSLLQISVEEEAVVCCFPERCSVLLDVGLSLQSVCDVVGRREIETVQTEHFV